MAITLIFFVITAFAGIEKEIPLNEVPDVVLKAAQKAVPGIELTEAEVEKTHKGVVYEIEGTLDGKELKCLPMARFWRLKKKKMMMKMKMTKIMMINF